MTDLDDMVAAGLSRRDVLKRAGVGGLAVAGGSGLLSACGGSSTSSGATSSGTGSSGSDTFAANAGTAGIPARGGNLRVAMIGNGTSENYNPLIVSTPIDTLHVAAVFDPMTRPAPHVGREAGLITNWASNKDATAWELTLRDGVTWHDGKPLTQEDLIFTLRSYALPTSLSNAAVANVKLRDLKKVGKNIVQVPLSLPIADLRGYFIYNNSAFIIQDGTKNFSKPVGTGPYKLESFVPGQRSVLSANREYWDSPKPYPDQLEIISIDDPAARLNALQGGQIDLCLNLPFADAKANLGGGGGYKVIVGEPGVSYTIYMRCDSGAFRDVRVRQAMKLIPDRQAMIEAAMSGFGTPGNDLLDPGTQYFAGHLQRHQDIEQAKSLLKAAGASDLTVTLHTAEVLPGFEAAATVFAQQAAAAGVTVNVKREQASQYFNPQILYLKESFAQDAWPGPSLNFTYSQLLLSNSVLNETHWKDPSWDQMFYKAQAETDSQKAQEMWNQLQQVQFDQGGYIVWSYWRSTDAASPKVRGFGEAGAGWLYGTDDDRVWNWGLA